MVIDSSAFIAWAREEPEAAAFEEAFTDAPLLVMSALNVFETKIVLARRFSGRGLDRFDAFLENLGVRVFAFDAEQATIAFDAYLRFGRGSRHRAQLNLGDCAAYALARTLHLPLLFKGNDFIHTDVESVLRF